MKLSGERAEVLGYVVGTGPVHISLCTSTGEAKEICTVGTCSTTEKVEERVRERVKRRRVKARRRLEMSESEI